MGHSKAMLAATLGVLAATTACSQAPATAPDPSRAEAQAPTRAIFLPDQAIGDREVQQVGRRRRDRDDDDDDDRDGRRRFGYRYFTVYPYYPSYQPYYPVTQPYAQNQVVIRGYQFLPGTLNVPIGTTVTWINQDSVPHTVTSPLPGQVTTTGAFDGVLQPGQSYSFTFNLPGRIDYYCRYHPSMRGSVTVGGGY